MLSKSVWGPKTGGINRQKMKACWQFTLLLRIHTPDFVTVGFLTQGGPAGPFLSEGVRSQPSLSVAG